MIFFCEEESLRPGPNIRYINRPISTRRRNATADPTPIPALAPDDKPDGAVSGIASKVETAVETAVVVTGADAEEDVRTDAVDDGDNVSLGRKSVDCHRI